VVVEVKLRRKEGKGRRILTVYLSCPPELRRVERELKRLGYLREGDEILFYQKTLKEVKSEKGRTRKEGCEESKSSADNRQKGN
jgi:coenzyme F420-reducing hydrogenase gamma subunit